MRRGALLVSLMALGLAACAPEGEDTDGAPGPYPGYELASAKAGRPDTGAMVKELSVDQLDAMIASGKVRLIDVRKHDEVAEGMIAGAEHIPMDAFDPAKVSAGDDRDIVIYCRSGRRSRIVAEKLAAHSGKPAVHLAGGIIAWNEAGKAAAMPQ